MVIKRQRMYRCGTCGKAFKSQGIGPHQRGMGHEGKTEIGLPVPATTPLSTTQQLAVMPAIMASPDLALRLLPFSLYEDEKGKRYIVLAMEDMEELK